MICGFIGLGLIGGSIAKALKNYDSTISVTAYDPNTEMLQLAHKEGIVNKTASGINEDFSDCDILFLCAPVSSNDSNLKGLKDILKPDCILTDVGSVKSTIHSAINELGLNEYFIGGHPMAGSERIGYANSNPLILQNAYYILTPTNEVAESKITFFSGLISGIGAIPLIMPYEKHDYITAGISHLPHVIASALVNLVRKKDGDDQSMKRIAAGGFKDITRIASSSPVMWEHICMTNTDNILGFLDDFMEVLKEIRTDISDRKREEIHKFFQQARTYRDSFINADSGPIKRVFDFTVDIEDKSGALASLVTLLAAHEISIKNIAIMHNRELREGSVRLEFPDEASLANAKEILLQNGYVTH